MPASLNLNSLTSCGLPMPRGNNWLNKQTVLNLKATFFKNLNANQREYVIKTTNNYKFRWTKCLQVSNMFHKLYLCTLEGMSMNDFSIFLKKWNPLNSMQFKLLLKFLIDICIENMHPRHVVAIMFKCTLFKQTFKGDQYITILYYIYYKH